VGDEDKMITRFLRKTELVLALAIVLALAVPAELHNFKMLIEISLGLLVFFSIRPFMGKIKKISNIKKEYIKPILLNYVLLSGAYALFGYIIFGTGHDFFIGYILLAIVPPAVSIIPFCYIAHCDKETADIPLIASFLISIILIPVALYLIFGETLATTSVLQVIVIVIIIPVLLAQKTWRSKARIFTYSKEILNILLAIVIFISISLNRTVFFNISDKSILYVYAINFLIIFGLGALTYILSGKNKTAYSFYATQKNVGTSITLGLVLFHPDTAVPAIISLAVQMIYFILFKWTIIKR
jgi:BASS family bile acid:Na+ symporter